VRGTGNIKKSLIKVSFGLIFLGLKSYLKVKSENKNFKKKIKAD
jgi:hypothetical protein